MLVYRKDIIIKMRRQMVLTATCKIMTAGGRRPITRKDTTLIILARLHCLHADNDTPQRKLYGPELSWRASRVGRVHRSSSE